MTATGLASRVDAPSTLPHAADADAKFNADDTQHLDILRELTASWHPISMVADRRPGHRIPCNFHAELVSLDEHGRASAAPALDVQVTDLSVRGIGIMHRHPMPHRLVLVTYETGQGHRTRLVVRLKWCRFKKADFYQSGGQIVRVLEGGDHPIG